MNNSAEAAGARFVAGIEGTDEDCGMTTTFRATDLCSVRSGWPEGRCPLCLIRMAVAMKRNAHEALASSMDRRDIHSASLMEKRKG